MESTLIINIIFYSYFSVQVARRICSTLFSQHLKEDSSMLICVLKSITLELKVVLLEMFYLKNCPIPILLREVFIYVRLS